MKVRLTETQRYSDHIPWATGGPKYFAGSIVNVIPATNIPRDSPDAIRYWIDEPEISSDCYGMGLRDGDFELIP